MINTLDRVSICIKLKMDAAHRIYGHENKCKDIHGHEYHFEIYCKADELDNLDRVADFGAVKRVLKSWIDENLDHGMLLGSNDPIKRLWCEEQWTQEYGAPENFSAGFLKGMKYFILDGNPTAENIASHVKQIGNQLLQAQDIKVHIYKVVCHETMGCSATAED